MVLYEISIIGAKVFGKKKPAEDDNTEVFNREKSKEDEGNHE